MVEAKTDGIRERRTEKVCLLQRGDLSCHQAAQQHVIDSVRSGVRRPIEHVRAKNGIFVRPAMIDAGCKEVLIDHLLTGERVVRNVAVTPRGAVRQVVERHEGGCSKIYAVCMRIRPNRWQRAGTGTAWTCAARSGTQRPESI